MADCMMFPNDWHDFIKDYSFIDSEQVYTNGSELIQVFRVIQLIEHLLKEQEAVVRCKDCENWIPGHITDQDDFIPPKCGKYQQMVGHSADDFCSLAEKQKGR